MAEAKICAIVGCEKRTLSRGWCATHYQRWLKHGDPAGRAQLDGIVVCARCGDRSARTGYNQRYCDPCRIVVANEAARDWKRKKRASKPTRQVEFMACELCQTATPKTSSARKYCPPCRAANDIEKSRQNARKSRELDPDRRKRWGRQSYQRRMSQPRYRIASRMSARMYEALKTGKAGRSWQSLVGYTLADLIRHLERQFPRGMSWENYGAWHIDHIRPVSSFSFASAEDQEFRDCWALTNLRPMWAKANMEKSSKRLLLV